MSNQLITIPDIERIGTAIAKSGLFGMKTPDQAIALCFVAASEGIHPARAALEYHIIQGRPSLKADAMLSRFQAAGGKVEWKEYTDEKVSGVFSHPQGGSIEIDWTIERAKQAGVYGKNPTWKSYPRAMLRSRCISEAIRTIYPGVSVGIYTPDEVQDFTHEEKDITPPPTQEKKVENVAKAKAAIKPAIEGEVIKPHARGTISGDASEGDLSMIPMIPKADMDKMLAAFAKIGMDADAVEAEYNKPIKDWSLDDFAEAREVFKVCKADWELKQVELKSINEEVI